MAIAGSNPSSQCSNGSKRTSSTKEHAGGAVPNLAKPPTSCPAPNASTTPSNKRRHSQRVDSGSEDIEPDDRDGDDDEVAKVALDQLMGHTTSVHPFLSSVFALP